MGFPRGTASDLEVTTVNWMDAVAECSHPVPIDLANLLYACAWLFAAQSYHGDYAPALGRLKSYLQAYQSNRKLKNKLFYILDGMEEELKGPEKLRRLEDRESSKQAILEKLSRGENPQLSDYRICVSVTSNFRMLAVKLLRTMGLNY